MSQQKIRFSNRDLSGFIPEVKAEVNQYFKDRELNRYDQLFDEIRAMQKRYIELNFKM